MMFVWVVRCNFGGHRDHNNWLKINKSVIKYKVVKTTAKMLHLAAFPYDNTTNVKIQPSECYTNLEDAKKACEIQATKLLEKLTEYSKEFEKEIEIIDSFADFKELQKDE